MSGINRPMSVKLDSDTRDRIEYLAEIRSRTTHWMLCEAVRQYVDREYKREVFRQETLKAWDEFQMTGLYATAEEVEAWLASWGTEDELPVPPCHE